MLSNSLSLQTKLNKTLNPCLSLYLTYLGIPKVNSFFPQFFRPGKKGLQVPIAEFDAMVKKATQGSVRGSISRIALSPSQRSSIDMIEDRPVEDQQKKGRAALFQKIEINTNSSQAR